MRNRTFNIGQSRISIIHVHTFLIATYHDSKRGLFVTATGLPGMYPLDLVKKLRVRWLRETNPSYKKVHDRLSYHGPDLLKNLLKIQQMAGLYSSGMAGGKRFVPADVHTKLLEINNGESKFMGVDYAAIESLVLNGKQPEEVILDEASEEVFFNQNHQK